MSMIYKTSFEDVVKIDEHHLNIPLRHNFNTQGEGGATFWIETNFAHDSSRCIGLEVFDNLLSKRCSFIITGLKELVGDEMTVEVWQYLPPGFTLNSSEYRPWTDLVKLIYDENPETTWYPAWVMGVHEYPAPYKPDLPHGWDLWIYFADIDGIQHNQLRIENFPLPIGRWYSIRYYVKRNPSEGAIKIWFDNRLIFDVSGVKTTHDITSEYSTIVCSDYFVSDAKLPIIKYCDDLTIWSGLATPKSPMLIIFENMVKYLGPLGLGLYLIKRTI